jgi:hypothetical protein
MTGMTSVEAAASASGKPRLPFGRSSYAGVQRQRAKNAAAYVAGGGSIADYARIHRMSTAAVRALLDGRAR